MDTQRHLEEDEIENQLVWDTDSDCFNDSEDSALELRVASKRKRKRGRATHYHHHSHLHHHHHRCGDHHSMTVGVRIIFPVEQRG
jgi:hypothetical protein